MVEELFLRRILLILSQLFCALFEKMNVFILLPFCIFRLEAVRVECRAGLKNIANTLMAKGEQTLSTWLWIFGFENYFKFYNYCRLLKNRVILILIIFWSVEFEV